MTLPAMSDEQIRAIFKQCERAGGYLDVQDVARALIAARDAQWQAAVDAAVMQERDKCAKLVETQSANGDYGVENWFHYLADRIRARTKEKT